MDGLGELTRKTFKGTLYVHYFGFLPKRFLHRIERYVDRYVIFTNHTSHMYCRHAKKNKIQLFKYKDCNGGLQPLRRAKNGHSAYTI